MTDDQLRDAAYLRWAAPDAPQSWEHIAEEIGCDAKTLLAARKTDRWGKVAKEFEVRKADLRHDAYVQLAKAVLAGKQWAITEALNRTEGAVEQTLELKGDGDGDRTNPAETAATIIAVLAECGILQAGTDQADDPAPE